MTNKCFPVARRMTLWGVCCFRAARVGNHLIIYMALVYRFADRNWLWKYGSITARNTGYEWLCITAWKNTREMELSFQATFHFNNTIPRSLMAENNLWIKLDRRRHGLRVSRTLFPSPGLCFRFFAWRNGLLLSILLVPLFGLPLSKREQTWWLDFLLSLYIPQTQAYFYIWRRACVKWLHHGMG
jgi:hypothetical protein